jgi:hypothetical protein
MGTYVSLGAGQTGSRFQTTVEVDQAACSARLSRLAGVLDLKIMFRFCYVREKQGLPSC